MLHMNLTRLLRFCRRRSSAELMLLVEPRQCVQGLKRIGNTMEAEKNAREARKASASNAAHAGLDGVLRRPGHTTPTVMRPKAR
jgi:hypothetical protein